VVLHAQVDARLPRLALGRDHEQGGRLAAPDVAPLGLGRVQGGEEALRQVLKRDYAAILLDVRMPGIDGFETAAAIRSLERTRRVPIIFLSGEGDRRADERDAYCEFILKPVDPDVIRPRVAQHLARFKQH
jgi:CheY-like chemotaxis protein